jgi:hypothetical protein
MLLGNKGVFMRGIIKGVLAEELENSLRMQKDYESALKKLPHGCLVKKEIAGHEYYYLVKRQGKRLINVYMGKLSMVEIKRHDEAKLLRAKYRSALSKVKKQVRFLKGALRGKEPI